MVDRGRARGGRRASRELVSSFRARSALRLWVRPRPGFKRHIRRSCLLIQPSEDWSVCHTGESRYDRSFAGANTGPRPSPGRRVQTYSSRIYGKLDMTRPGLDHVAACARLRRSQLGLGAGWGNELSASMPRQRWQPHRPLFGMAFVEQSAGCFSPARRPAPHIRRGWFDSNDQAWAARGAAKARNGLRPRALRRQNAGKTPRTAQASRFPPRYGRPER